MKRPPLPQIDMRARRLGWSKRLAHQVTLHDGSKLDTLGDVRSFVFKRMRTDGPGNAKWQRVTALLLAAARNDDTDVAEVGAALQMALSQDERQPSQQRKQSIGQPPSRREHT